MALYPALDVVAPDADLVLALVDEFSPTAVEEQPDCITIFFGDIASRDHAQAALVHANPATQVAPRDVDDGDWARRSQESLGPVTVGRITIAPPWAVPDVRGTRDPQLPGAGGQTLLVVVQPSMGFGTGHHATTRLCLAALQAVDLAGSVVLDVGTGSGVLAMASRLLGARRALGIDNDPDAIQSARENLTLNPGLDNVCFELGELAVVLSQPEALTGMGVADVLVANLTGSALVRSAGILLSSIAPAGTLVLSGILAAERSDVLSAVRGTTLLEVKEEDGWLAVVLRREADRF